MIKILQLRIFQLLTLILLGLMGLQNSFASCQDEEATPFPQENALLWEVTAPDGAHSTYIFGTIHIQDEAVLSKADLFMDEAFSTTNALWVELNPEEVNLHTIADNIVMEDTTLKMLMDEEDFQKLESWAINSIGLPPDMVNRIKPLYLHSLYMLTNQLGNASQMQEVQDQRIINEAKEQGIEVKALETAKEQFDALNEIPIKDQVEELVETMNRKNPREGLDKLISIYLEENLSRLYEFSTEFNTMEFGKQSLVIDRNKNMWGKIKAETGEKEMAVAVGALHLPGEYGLLNLACTDGYEIQPVSLD